MSWNGNVGNEDGLQVRFDLEKAAVRADGLSAAKERYLVIDLLDATTVGNTDTAAISNNDEAFIPAGAYVTSATFFVDTAFTSGGSAVLDVGLKQADGTNIDDDGVDSLAVANLTVRAGIESDGALVPSKMQYDSYVMFTYDTAAFTAGAGRLVIKYLAD